MTVTALGYVVEYTVRVDHPELRDATFTPVPANSRVRLRVWCPKQSIATREADRLLRGEDDFSSEFVDEVRVLRLRDGRSADFVRRTRIRDTRGDTWRTL